MNLIYDDCLKEKSSENKSNNFTEDIVQKNIPDEILTIDILKEWPLSERSFNVLNRENIQFLGDLLQYDLKDLLK